jgi:hypothetical protein
MKYIFISEWFYKVHFEKYPKYLLFLLYYMSTTQKKEKEDWDLKLSNHLNIFLNFYISPS